MVLSAKVMRDNGESYDLTVTNPTDRSSGMEVTIGGFDLQDFMSGDPITLALEIEWSVGGFVERRNLRQQLLPDQSPLQLSSRNENSFSDSNSTHGTGQYKLQIILAMPPPEAIVESNEGGDWEPSASSSSTSWNGSSWRILVWWIMLL